MSIVLNGSTGITTPAIDSAAAVGAVSYFATSSAPSGYIKANGATLSRTTYASLFAVTGTIFGAGDGSTTFEIPDLRGEFLRGWDDARGIDGSRAFGSAQADELKSHAHDLTRVMYNPIGGSSTNGGYIDAMWGIADLATVALDSYVVATGGTETRPRNMALLACIKY